MSRGGRNEKDDMDEGVGYQLGVIHQPKRTSWKTRMNIINILARRKKDMRTVECRMQV